MTPTEASRNEIDRAGSPSRLIAVPREGVADHIEDEDEDEDEDEYRHALPPALPIAAHDSRPLAAMRALHGAQWAAVTASAGQDSAAVVTAGGHCLVLDLGTRDRVLIPARKQKQNRGKTATKQPSAIAPVAIESTSVFDEGLGGAWSEVRRGSRAVG